jgi:hypothetical protein
MALRRVPYIIFDVFCVKFIEPLNLCMLTSTKNGVRASHAQVKIPRGTKKTTGLKSLDLSQLVRNTVLWIRKYFLSEPDLEIHKSEPDLDIHKSELRMRIWTCILLKGNWT